MNYYSFLSGKWSWCLGYSIWSFLQGSQKCINKSSTTRSNGSWVQIQLDTNGCITTAKQKQPPPPFSFLGLPGCPRHWPPARTHQQPGPSWPACVLIGRWAPCVVWNIFNVSSGYNKLELFQKAGRSWSRPRLALWELHTWDPLCN